MANRPWSKDELILALDVYLQRDKRPSRDRLLELSDLLRGIAAQAGEDLAENFRNINSVSMKIDNFRAIDPDVVALGRRSLPKGNRLDKEVWSSFAHRPEHLREVASRILEAVALPAQLEAFDVDPSFQEAEEGAILTRVHVSRERSRKLVQDAKNRFRRRHGQLFCEACGLKPNERYGEGFDSIIECHHKLPVSELDPGQKTRVSDLLLLCPTCHRAVHSAPTLMSIDELKTLLAKGLSD